jgi:hypothetical protein
MQYLPKNNCEKVTSAPFFLGLIDALPVYHCALSGVHDIRRTVYLNTPQAYCISAPADI